MIHYVQSVINNPTQLSGWNIYIYIYFSRTAKAKQSDAFDLDTELGARLVAIAPCLDAQLKAKQEGKIARSSSGLVNRDVHVLGGAAKHNFEVDNFKQPTPSNARSMQRCQLKKDVSGEQQNCGKVDFRRIDCPSCHLAIWQTIAADHDKEVEEPIHGKLEGGTVGVGQVTVEQLQVVETAVNFQQQQVGNLKVPKLKLLKSQSKSCT